MIVATGRGQKRASSEHAYDRFVKEANELITTSNAIGDGWKWIVDRNDDAAGNTARCFPVRGVTKTFLRPIAGAQPAKMANWTYEVIYSPAFDVPVVYFQAVNDGALSPGIYPMSAHCLHRWDAAGHKRHLEYDQ